MPWPVSVSRLPTSLPVPDSVCVVSRGMRRDYLTPTRFTVRRAGVATGRWGHGSTDPTILLGTIFRLGTGRVCPRRGRGRGLFYVTDSFRVSRRVYRGGLRPSEPGRDRRFMRPRRCELTWSVSRVTRGDGSLGTLREGTTLGGE